MCAASDAILRGITLAHKPGAFAVKLSILTLIILRVPVSSGFSQPTGRVLKMHCDVPLHLLITESNRITAFHWTIENNNGIYLTSHNSCLCDTAENVQTTKS